MALCRSRRRRRRSQLFRPIEAGTDRRSKIKDLPLSRQMGQIRCKSRYARSLDTLQVMSILVRVLEKVGILCGLVYAAWLNFIDPMCAYLAGDGSPRTHRQHLDWLTRHSLRGLLGFGRPAADGPRLLGLVQRQKRLAAAHALLAQLREGDLPPVGLAFEKALQQYERRFPTREIEQYDNDD